MSTINSESRANTVLDANDALEFKRLTADFISLQNNLDNHLPVDRDLIPPSSPVSAFEFEDTYRRLPTFPNVKDIELPLVREKGIKACIEELAIIFECPDYKFNFLHFWFLDVITDCIWMCQDKFDFPTEIQKTVLGWILFAFDLIRDPSKNLTRDEFLEVFKETACMVSDLIEEGCYDIPVPLEMVTVVPKEERHYSTIGEWNEEKVSGSSTSISTKKLSDEQSYLSCVEFRDRAGINVHIMEQERCNCSLADDTSTKITMSSTDETESSKVPPSDFHDLYKADLSTPPRFKSFEEIKEMKESVEAESILDDKFFIKLEEASLRESSKYSIVDETKMIKSFVIFQRPTWDESSSNKSKSSIFPEEEEEEEEESIVSQKQEIPKYKQMSKELEPKISTESQMKKKLMEGLKLYNLWEQREKDLANPRVGLEPWQMEEQSDVDKISDKETVEEEEDEDEDLLDDDLLSILNEQDINELNEQEYLSFGVLWAIINFVYSYFSESFQYKLIKLALTAPPNIITQNLNDIWLVPKDLREDLTTYVKDMKDKYKRIPVKKKKPGKEKKPKAEKKPKEKKEKPPKPPKPPKLTKEEKNALKLEEKLLKLQLQAEEELRYKAEMNRVCLFPLQDAAPEDEFFKEKFKNFKKVNIKRGKMGKGKKGK